MIGANATSNRLQGKSSPGKTIVKRSASMTTPLEQFFDWFDHLPVKYRQDPGF